MGYKHKCKRCGGGWETGLEKPQRCGVCGSGLWDQERRRAVGGGRPGIKKDREAGGGKGGISKRGGAGGPKASAGQGQVGAGGSGIREGEEPEEGSGVGVDTGVGRVGSGAAYIFKGAMNDKGKTVDEAPGEVGQVGKEEEGGDRSAGSLHEAKPVSAATGRGGVGQGSEGGGGILPKPDGAHTDRGTAEVEESPAGRMWVGDAARDCGKSVKQVMALLVPARRASGLREESPGRWSILSEWWSEKRESEASAS
jgi:hypothetical protein